MCGISGIVGLQPIDSRYLVGITRRVAHRGPDGEGYWILPPGDGATGIVVHDTADVEGMIFRAGFGHRRLSILDLSTAGAQPMTVADGSLCITYNGEVFNYLEIRADLERYGHRFRTGTDTEVVLAAYRQWGPHCFSSFNGMWALAIADLEKRSIVFSRDRLGIKPLYISRAGGRLAFGSEIKQLLTLPWVSARADIDSVVEYIDTGYQIPGTTFFQDVYEFEPGTWSEFSLETLKPGASGSIWSPTTDHREVIPRERLVEGTRAIFEDSVRIRLRSDVPVGVCLSGGLDSSSIFSQMHAFPNVSGGRTHAFSATYGNPRFDEDRYINSMLRRFGGIGHYIEPDPETFLEELETFVYYHDEPPGSMSVYASWCVMRLARRNNVPVLLNGQGGDELFAGYWPSYYLHLGRLLRTKPHRALWDAATAAFPGGNHILLKEVLPHFRQYISRKQRRNRDMLQDRWKDSGRTLLLNWAQEAQRIDPYDYRLRELRSVHLPRLLKWEDRNSMAFGIEGRYPFLDYRLVELAVSAPPEANLRHGWNKLLLRDAFAGLLSDDIRWRRSKIGFETPQSEWIRSTLASALRAWSLHPSETLLSIIKGDRLDALISQLTSRRDIGKMDERQHLFIRLFLLDAWLRVFQVELPDTEGWNPALSQSTSLQEHGDDAGARLSTIPDDKPTLYTYLNGDDTTLSHSMVAERTLASYEAQHVSMRTRTSSGIRVGIVTSEWPSEKYPNAGLFVRLQVELLRERGIDVRVFPFRGDGNPFKYARAWIAFRRFLRRHECDIIHAHFGQSALVVLPTAHPLVITFHGSDLEGFIGPRGRQTLQGRLLRHISRVVARRSDGVILVSSSLSRQLPAGIDAIILPGGVDTTIFKPLDRDECRSLLGWNSEDFILLFAADPTNPIKQFHLAEGVVHGLPSAMRARLEVAWGLEHSRMPLYMNAADVLLLTSANEGSPTVVKEAIACGLPVIATPVGDVHERLEKVQGSFVCADGTVDAIADAVLRLYSRNMEQGRPAFHPGAVVSESANADSIITLYRRLCNR